MNHFKSETADHGAAGSRSTPAATFTNTKGGKSRLIGSSGTGGRASSRSAGPASRKRYRTILRGLVLFFTQQSPLSSVAPPQTDPRRSIIRHLKNRCPVVLVHGDDQL